jgi:hypothetical protein
MQALNWLGAALGGSNKADAVSELAAGVAPIPRGRIFEFIKASQYMFDPRNIGFRNIPPPPIGIPTSLPSASLAGA